MSEMVKRVARAINAQYPDNRTWDHQTRDNRAQLMKAARAAIEAMREPTVDQLEACGNHGVGRIIWRQMIDEALK